MSSIRYSGQGELFWGDKYLATVSYALIYTPPRMASDRMIFATTSGRMKVIEGERDFMQFHATLTLHLEDDQRLDVLIDSQPGIPLPQFGGEYKVSGTGPIRPS